MKKDNNIHYLTVLVTTYETCDCPNLQILELVTVNTRDIDGATITSLNKQDIFTSKTTIGSTIN